MSAELNGKVLSALSARKGWEEKQRVWYRMRHEGLGRRKPPFPGAADLHFPLIDGAIDKIKPFYYNQIFQGERIAEFTALEADLAAQRESAADFFNWEVREETNFETEILTAIDEMLLRGRGVLKVFWDPFKERLCFSAIDPVYFVVPPGVDNLEEDADFFTHIRRYTVPQYERDPRFIDHSEATLQRIRGSADVPAALHDKYAREGLTYSTNDDEIIIHETYEKTRGGWTIHTYSPQAPSLPLRPSFGVTYRMKGRHFVPFISFQMEIKDKGWYAPRGLAERLAPFEAMLCKLLNEKADAMTYLNSPLFESDEVLAPNLQNFRLRPGEILPKGVRRAQSPQIPDSFDREIQQQRMIAEQYIQMPDAGLAPDATQTLTGGNHRVTATQINYQSSLASTGIDLRARIFRRALAGAYRRSWCILVQHRKDELAFFSATERKLLPPQALAESYLVEPSGSPDSWNKAQRIQRAVTRKQMFQGDPTVNQEELTKDVLAADDPRLIQRLFQPAGAGQQNEAQDEAIDVLLLQSGWPAQVAPNEDHAVRIQVLLGFLQKMNHTGAPVDPVALQRIHQHVAQHLQILQQQNPKAAKEVMALIQQAEAQPGSAATDEAPPVQPGAEQNSDPSPPAPNPNFQAPSSK
jgi:hypothetical protein